MKQNKLEETVVLSEQEQRERNEQLTKLQLPKTPLTPDQETAPEP